MKILLKSALITVLLINCSTSFAQVPINFGFTGGISQSKYKIGLDSINGEAVTAWQAGVFARIKVKKLYVGADLLFVSTPGKFNSTSGKTKGEITVMGLDIPIYLGWKVVDKKAFNLRLYGGPNMQLNFIERVKTSYNGSEFETNNDIQFKGGPKWSLVGGAGIDIAFFTFDVRYLYSVSDWSNLSQATINNSGVQLNLGFKIL